MIERLDIVPLWVGPRERRYQVRAGGALLGDFFTEGEARAFCLGYERSTRDHSELALELGRRVRAAVESPR